MQRVVRLACAVSVLVLLAGCGGASRAPSDAMSGRANGPGFTDLPHVLQTFRQVCDAHYPAGGPGPGGSYGWVWCGTDPNPPLQVLWVESSADFHGLLRGQIAASGLLHPDRTTIGRNWAAFGSPSMMAQVRQKVGGQAFSPAMTQATDGCQRSSVRTTFGPIVALRRQSYAVPIKITNVSAATCTLAGGIGARLVGRDGDEVAAAKDDQGISTYHLVDQAGQTVTIGPGQSAWTIVAWWRGSGITASHRSARLEIVLPNGAPAHEPLSVRASNATLNTVPVQSAKPDLSR